MDAPVKKKKERDIERARVYVMSKGLLFDGGLTAKGTETRNTKKGSIPYSPREKDNSLFAQALIDGINDDEDAQIWLTEKLSTMVVLRVNAEGWNLNVNPDKIAEVLLYDYFNDKPLSEVKIAEMLDKQRDTYRRNWKEKIGILSVIPKRWLGELS